MNLHYHQKHPHTIAARIFMLLVLFITAGNIESLFAQQKNAVVNLVYSSDAHYGLTRPQFRGDTGVSAHVVNAAMISEINALPRQKFPADNGVNAGRQINSIDYLVQTGDITNRMEIPIQSAAASWAQFANDYLHGLQLHGSDGRSTQILLAPGNHDISNAIGYSKPMLPLTDPTTMVNIYNLMLKPEKPMTNKLYNYATDKINYSRDINGIHLMFITLWPDSAERIWMQHDLENVTPSTPVIIFTHDQPTCEAKHFTNPLPPHNMTIQNKFEDLTTEYYKESTTAMKDAGATDLEQRGWTTFLKAHPNIKAYFHGNSNWNEFYVYKGPDNDVSLNTFRVDSPMKGKYSAKDETLLSFQLISLDTDNQSLTVRECLWNTKPANKQQATVFGKSITVSLKVHQQ